MKTRKEKLREEVLDNRMSSSSIRENIISIQNEKTLFGVVRNREWFLDFYKVDVEAAELIVEILDKQGYFIIENRQEEEVEENWLKRNADWMLIIALPCLISFILGAIIF